jgi:hypothetical protein
MIRPSSVCGVLMGSMLGLLDRAYSIGDVGYCELAPASVCARHANTAAGEAPCTMRNLHGSRANHSHSLEHPRKRLFAE